MTNVEVTTATDHVKIAGQGVTCTISKCDVRRMNDALLAANLIDKSALRLQGLGK